MKTLVLVQSGEVLQISCSSYCCVLRAWPCREWERERETERKRERQRGLLGSDWAPGPGRKQLESPDYSVDTYARTHNSSNTTGFSDLPGWIVTTHCTGINHTHAHWGFLSLCVCNNHTHLYEHTRGRCFVSSGRRRGGGVPGLWITLLAVTGGAFLCVCVCVCVEPVHL